MARSEMSTAQLGRCVPLSQAVKRLGVSREVALRLALRGQLRCLLVGESKVYVAAADVERLAAERAPQRLVAPQVTTQA